MKIKLYSLFLIFLLSVTTVFASVFDYPANIFSVIDNLPELNNINCTFKQEKQLRNIEKPIISEGNFQYIKNEGIIFETLKPIKSTVSYTNKNYKQINDIVLAISKKKYSKLEKEFDVFFHKNNSWELGLKPKKSSSAEEYLNSITIKGNDYINQIIISMKNGNITTIWFTKK